MSGTDATFDVYKVPVALSETDEANLFFPDLNSLEALQKILSGATYPIKLLDEILGRGAKTIVDIGANVGGFSLLTARRWPGSRVLAFEPGKVVASCLNENLAFAPGALCLPFGLAQGNHHLPLHSHAYGSICASVGDTVINDAGGDLIELRDAGHTLRELGVTAIDILKIDTEGCEVPILRSLESFLPTAKTVLIEYHKEDDRRTIDALLGPTHYLCKGSITAPHRGELCYGLQSLLSQKWESNRIDLPLALSA